MAEMDSIRKIKNLSSELSKIALESEKRAELWSQIEQRIDNSLCTQSGNQDAIAIKQNTKRRKFAFAQVGAVLAGCAVVAFFAFGIIYNSHNYFNKSTSVTKPIYPVFIPPKNMLQTFQITSDGGSLRVVGYAEPRTANNMYAQRLYVITNKVGTSPHVLYDLSDSQNWIFGSETFWFGHGERQYLAFLQNTPSGDRLFLQEFSQLNSDAWNVKSLGTTVIPGSDVYKLDTQHLLLESRGVGDQDPIEYTLSSNGISHVTISDSFPKPGEVPNSTSITLYVSGTPNAKGGTDFKTTGDVSSVHMHIGQHLIIRVVYNTKTKLPLEFLLYPDYGDPGPGSLADLEPSPYINARVYTMVNTAQHGFIVVEPLITGADTSPDKFIKIPIDVQK